MAVKYLIRYWEEIRKKNEYSDSQDVKLWDVQQILDEVNSDRSEEWEDYDESDWEEGLEEFTEFETVKDPNGNNILVDDDLEYHVKRENGTTEVIKGLAVAYDGCHKIYILEDTEDVKKALEIGYEIHNMSELIQLYNTSCELRFINNWKLNKTFVAQFENAQITKRL